MKIEFCVQCWIESGKYVRDCDIDCHENPTMILKKGE